MPRFKNEIILSKDCVFVYIFSLSPKYFIGVLNDSLIISSFSDILYIFDENIRKISVPLPFLAVITIILVMLVTF